MTVTQAALVDPLTGYTIPAGVLNGNQAEWPQVYAGQYTVVAQDSNDADISASQILTVTRAATISQTLTAPQARIFHPLIFR